MSRRIGVSNLAGMVCAVCAVGSLALSAYLFGGGDEAAIPIDSHRLIVDPSYLNFGEPWEQPAFLWKVAIRNGTPRELIVRGLRGTCSCTSVEPSELVLRGGETQEITMTLDLTMQTSGRRPESLGRDYSIGLVAEVSDAEDQIGSPGIEKWSIHGRVQEAIRLSTPSVRVRDPLEYEAHGAVETVELSVGAGVSRVEAICDPALAKVWIEPAADRNSRPDFRRMTLHIMPQGTLEAGPFEFSVKLSPQVTSGDMLVPASTVNVSGDVRAEVDWSPRTLVFGPAAVGLEQEEVMLFWSRNGEGFEVAHVREGDERRSFQGVAPVDRHEGHESREVAFRVVQTIGHIGRRTESMHLLLSGPNLRRPIRATVPIQIYGHVSDTPRAPEVAIPAN